MTNQPHNPLYPVIGYMVHFHLGDPNRGPYPGWGITPNGSNTYAAKIAYIHSPHMVNLAVWDANGIQMSFTSVTLVHQNEERPAGHWCEYPHSKGQALEDNLSAARRMASAGEPLIPMSQEERNRLNQHIRIERDAHARRKPAPDDDPGKPEHWPASGQPPTLNTPYTPGDPAAQRSSSVYATRQDFQNAVSERHPAIAATQPLDNEGRSILDEGTFATETAVAEAHLVPHAFESDGISGGGKSPPIESDGVGGTGRMPEGNEAT